MPAKSADELTIQLCWLTASRSLSPSIPTDFCAYDLLEEDEKFDREYVVQEDGEYADDAVHVNTCESHA